MIFENILSFIKETLEYKNYMSQGGFTQINFVIIIALISAGIQSWGILRQNKRIWNNKSGVALPLSFFAFQLFYYTAYLIYGAKIKSGTLIITNFIGILFLPIIIGLIKFKLKEGYSFKKDLLVCPLLSLMIPCVLLVEKRWSLIAILFIAMAVFSNLIYEVVKARGVRNIEPKYIYSVLLGALIWLWYGWQINDLGLIISSAATMFATSLFLSLYLTLKYLKPKPGN
jgi:uncharacterized protein with PQ loop repeat